MWWLCLCFVNIPAPEDNAKLHHIGNILKETTGDTVGKMLMKNIDKQHFPNHFVVNAKFNIQDNALLLKTASKHTIQRLLNAHKDNEFDFAI